MPSKVKNFIGLIAGSISPTLATKIWFRHFVGYRLNLSEPTTLNEKIQYCKLNYYHHNPLVTKCSDKIAVREFVAERIGEQYLTKLLGVWDSGDDIDFAALPDQFALKCNHGCGTNIICVDKSKLDIPKAKKQLNGWLKLRFGASRIALVYDDIVPRIIGEEFIKTNNTALTDYKFYCNYGKAKVICVVTDRFQGQIKIDYFDMEWNHYPLAREFPNSEKEIPKPDNLDEMILLAEKLSEEFPLVRIDLYNENGKIIFGEMTFLPGAGMGIYKPQEYDRILGDLFDIK